MSIAAAAFLAASVGGVEFGWIAIAASAFLSVAAEAAVAGSVGIDDLGVESLPMSLFCADGD
jgi:hypothetical protein